MIFIKKLIIPNRNNNKTKLDLEIENKLLLKERYKVENFLV